MTKWNDGLYPPGMSQSDHDREFGGPDPKDLTEEVCPDCWRYVMVDGTCGCNDYYIPDHMGDDV